MATRAHSTRTPLLPPPGATPPLLPRGLGRQPGPASTKALKDRVAKLRGALAAKKTDGPDPHVPLRERLIEAHAAAMAVRPTFEIEHPNSAPYKAALAIDNQLWQAIRQILALPPPTTVEGLKVVGLALAFEVEGTLAGKPWENEDKLAAAARAILAVTGTALPASFTGFGDENAREGTLCA